MESITIYPKNEKQKTLLKSLLEEMKVRFEVGTNDESLLSEEEFYSKIDKSIEQAEKGKLRPLTSEEQKEFLGL
ncbi:MAG TPA: DUF2683 family protein [Moheibacter sp.]|nr:DUF2683 family protein [Moheibacter sp.]